MEEEFQFLLCEKCQKEAPSPKLLSCLHTLCSECFDEHNPVKQCPVCGVSVRRFQDNLLFPHLQGNLDSYRKLVTGTDLGCSRCKEAAEFWCSECNQFLCRGCYEAHQWYLKQKGHETRKIEDIKVDTATEFLRGVRKACTLFCSSPAHSNQGQVSSLYCRQCRRALCCACALLDNEHAKFYSDINTEIQQRKEELERMSAELLEKNRCYEQTYHDLQQKVQQVEQVKSETQELIREKVEEMVRQVRQKGDQFLEEVDKQLHRERQEAQEKLRAMEQVVNRMKTSKLLVEKMSSFASDQIVMDMHPFIKESLEELKREKAPLPELRHQRRNFAEVKEQLQALFTKVTGQRDMASTSHAAIASGAPPSVTPPPPSVSSPSVNMEVSCNERNLPKAQGGLTPSYTLQLEKNHLGIAPSITARRKRLFDRCEKCSQTSPKVAKQDVPGSQCEKSVQASPRALKHEDHDSQEGETSTAHIQDAATGPPCTRKTTPERDQRIIVNSADVDSPPLEIADSEVASIVISSSEDTDVDAM